VAFGCASSGLTNRLAGYTDGVMSVAFAQTPDGRMPATASFDDTVEAVPRDRSW
jgi:hypothetical protein